MAEVLFGGFLIGLCFYVGRTWLSWFRAEPKLVSPKMITDVNRWDEKVRSPNGMLMLPRADIYGGKSLKSMEPTIGLEPMTCRLRIGCSTN